MSTCDLCAIVGDKYPSAKVRGIDMTPIQPKWVPPNVLFIIDDCELDWLEKDIDLVHFRFTIAVLKDTSKVLGHAFECVHSVYPSPRLLSLVFPLTSTTQS